MHCYFNQEIHLAWYRRITSAKAHIWVLGPTSFQWNKVIIARPHVFITFITDLSYKLELLIDVT